MKRKKKIGGINENMLEERKPPKLTRWRWRRFVMLCCWILFLSAFLWSIYKNFTGIDKVTEKTTEVVKQEVQNTSGVETFVKNFAVAYYEYSTDSQMQFAQAELLKNYLADGLSDYCVANSAEFDVSVTNVQIWNVELKETGKYAVTYSVTQKSNEDISTGVYTVFVGVDGNRYAITKLPFISSMPERAECKADIPVQVAQVKAEKRDKVEDFLETFFKIYPTADVKELKYYFKDKDVAAVNRDLEFVSVDNIVITENGDASVDVGCFVNYSNGQTGLDEINQYTLKLEIQQDGEYVIAEMG